MEIPHIHLGLLAFMGVGMMEKNTRTESGKGSLDIPLFPIGSGSGIAGFCLMFYPILVWIFNWEGYLWMGEEGGMRE